MIEDFICLLAAGLLAVRVNSSVIEEIITTVEYCSTRCGAVIILLQRESKTLT